MKYKVTHDGVTKTYAALHHTAWHLLDVAKARAEGSLLNLQAATVFYAFAFEAYLNHVGQEECEVWEEIERIPTPKKLRVITKLLGMQVDMGKPPFQAIRELFALRDLLAHGRTRKIDVQYETEEEPPIDSSWRLYDWEKLTAEKVEDYAACLLQAVETINGARRTPDKMVWSQGIRGRRVELLEHQGRASTGNAAARKSRRG